MTPAPWTTADIERVCAVLARHTRIVDALPEIKAELGRDRLSLRRLREVFHSAGVSAQSFLYRSDRIRGPSASPPVLRGQEIRAVSTLTGADGEKAAEWVKTQQMAVEPPRDPAPPDWAVKRVSTMHVNGDARVQWTRAEPERVEAWEAFRAACAEHAAQYTGLAVAQPAPAVVADEALHCVYPLGDPHIGLLAWAPETGEHYDLHIAERDLMGAVDMLINMAPAARSATLANLGDMFHAQTDDQRTPRAGHKLDVEGRRIKIMRLVLDMMRRMVDGMLLKHERVRVLNVPGNHDPDMASMVALWMQAVYADCSRVEVDDATSPYVYETHGKCLIGYAHGDGAPLQQLPAIMANDRAVEWGQTRWHHWFTGHRHSKHWTDYPGCSVEVCRTMAAPDYWTHWKGFRSQRSLSVVTIHEAYGEIGRATATLAHVRAIQENPT